MNAWVEPTVKRLVLLRTVQTKRTIGQVLTDCVLAQLAPDSAAANRKARKQEAAHAPAR